MKALRSVEAEVIYILMITDAIGIVVKLDLCSILAKELNVYLVPHRAVRRPRIREKRGHNAIIFDRLHADVIHTETKRLFCAVLRTGKITPTTFYREVHLSAGERDVVSAP